MVVPAATTRTLVTLGASVATLVTALVLSPRRSVPPVPAPAPIEAPPAPVEGCLRGALSDGVVVQARPGSSAILAGDHDEPIAVLIRAPATVAVDRAARPPLAVAVVIDRSGSMDGDAIRDAKAAAARLVDRLGPQDEFTIITYSSADEVIAPLAHATPDAKARAAAAIARIDADGTTCISCGLTRAAQQLAAIDTPQALGRIVLISDGQANEGLYDRNDLIALAATTAAAGTSISTIGVGLEFDEVTLTQLATVGHGAYHFVELTANLDAVFDRELGDLGATIATRAALTLEPGPGVELLEAYGYPSGAATSGALVVPIADLRAGEVRKVVVRAHVRAGAAAVHPLLTARLAWRSIGDGGPRAACGEAAIQVVTDPAAVLAGRDAEATRAIEEALSARTLEEATAAYERGGYDAARTIIDQHGVDRRTKAGIVGVDTAPIEQAEAAALADFAAAPTGGSAGAKAVKASRQRAYDLAR
jgi:Ca-activated chloride channel family protein